MSTNQRKTLNKKLSTEHLFTPRNSRGVQSQRSLDYESSDTPKIMSRDMDLRQTLLLQGRPTLKNSLKTKSRSFLKNIKDELSLLKNEMDRVIKNDTEETSYQDMGLLRAMKQSNSENHSEVSEEVEQQQETWHYNMMKKPVDESSILSDITEKRLKFFEQENAILSSQLKKMKNKYKQYKLEADKQIMMLHNKLTRAENIVANNQEQLLEYKREVEDEMRSIKKMLQQGGQGTRKPQDNSIHKLSIKTLEDQNSTLRKTMLQLKQNLLQKQKLIISQANRIETVLKQNQKLKQQLEQLNQQFYAEISNNTFFKCGESHINYEYSKSRIEQDESKVMFHLEDALVRKDSGGKVSGVKMNVLEQKCEELRRMNEGLVEERNKYVKERELMNRLLEEKEGIIEDMTIQKEVFQRKIPNMEYKAEYVPESSYGQSIEAQTQTQHHYQPSTLNTRDSYIKQLQMKLEQLSNSHQQQTTKLREQISTLSSKTQSQSNLWINDDILRQQDSQIQRLKRQLISKHDQTQKLRQALGTLHIEMRNTRSELEISNLKYMKEKKQFAEEQEAAMLKFKSQMDIMESVNRQLAEKIKIVNEDKNQKDEFIKNYIIVRINQDEKSSVEEVFEKFKLQFDGEYFKQQIFKEWKMILEFRRQMEEMREGK